MDLSLIRCEDFTNKYLKRSCWCPDERRGRTGLLASAAAGPNTRIMKPSRMDQVSLSVLLLFKPLGLLGPAPVASHKYEWTLKEINP